MKYFTGTYKNKLDQKGKVPIPKNFRSILGECDRVYLIQGIDGKYIRMYPLEKYEQMLSNILARPESETLGLKRIFTGLAHPVVIDQVGRIQIPQSLREFATIDNCELDFVGVIEWVEIWEKGQMEKSYGKPLDENVQKMLKLLDTVRNQDGVA